MFSYKEHNIASSSLQALQTNWTQFIYVRILKDSYIMFCVDSINTAYLECTTSTTPTCPSMVQL